MLRVLFVMATEAADPIQIALTLLCSKGTSFRRQQNYTECLSHVPQRFYGNNLPSEQVKLSERKLYVSITLCLSKHDQVTRSLLKALFQ